MTTLQQTGVSAAVLLNADDAGSETWWRRLSAIGTPLIDTQRDGLVKMHFFWRDPAGSEASSQIARVYVDVNCVTDHHSTRPESMQRLPGTDIWHWATAIEADWRGSYSLVPVTDDLLPPTFSDDPLEKKRQQRAWWISLFPHAIADPLNPTPAHFSNARRQLSSAQMPDAPCRAAWIAHDNARREANPARLQLIEWQSERLANSRRIWLYTTGKTDSPASRPVVLLLDGQTWAQGLPLFGVLDDETERGHLPPACWVFIDVIGMESREAELPCNPAFWQAIQHELLPLVQRHAPFSNEADRTVVAGQSYGGLAALYAGLHFPERFGRVLSQSGSFWWPNMKFMSDFAHRETHQPGWLTQQVLNGALPGSLTIFQEAGNREADIEFVNHQMNRALTAAGHEVKFRIYSGGHDALCWRSGLIEGLQWLLSGTLFCNE